MTDIASLKKQRAIIKASCTRVKTYVDNIVSLTPAIVAQVEERKEKLNEYWSEYNDVQTQIESLDENEANNRVTFEEAFFSLSGRIREHIKPALPNLPEGSRSSSRASDTVAIHSNVRLPKLNLPTFSGRYDEWFPFHDSFNSINTFQSHAK